jgi:hypothetical protein
VSNDGRVRPRGGPPFATTTATQGTTNAIMIATNRATPSNTRAASTNITVLNNIDKTYRRCRRLISSCRGSAADVINIG